MPSPVAAGVVKPGAVSDAMPEGTATTALRPTKLFIGGITRNTTTKQLRDHFSAFGRVLDCVAMRQPDGRPRGFGYVTLDSPQAADRSLVEPQVIDGRVVDLKRAVPEGDMETAPQTRLHTPASGSNRAKPASTGLLSTPGLISPSSGSSSPTASSWPFAVGPSHCLAATPNPAHAALAAAAAASAAAAACWHPHWAAAVQSMAGLSSGPDCMELLSTSPTQQAVPSALLSTQPLQLPDSGLPETPTGVSGLMSASAPEFVPTAGLVAQASSAEEQKPESAVKPKQRAALGEITNTVVSTKDAGMEALEKSDSDKVRQAPKLEIDTDAIFEDPEVILSPPGLELPASRSISDNSENVAPASDAEVESAENLGSLPSLGSADHAAGTCKRCNFFAKGRCQNGKNCTFCHLPHDKRKITRQEKRERKGQIKDEQENRENQENYEEHDVQQVMAYPMFPGMPAMQTTKLPTPLALPGNVMPCFSRSPVAPPPGLTQSFGYASQAGSAIPWQPDEEISPMCAQTPAQRASITGSVLSTVPVSPSSAFTATQPEKPLQKSAGSPMTVRVPNQIQAMDVSMEPKKVMVTMGTQTDEDDAEDALSRDKLLQFQHTPSIDEVGLRADTI